MRVDGAAPWVGVCRDKVTCVTLGCPPCLSRNLRLPFVTSFVLGDDMVPRTSHESLRRLKLRLLQVGVWVWEEGRGPGEVVRGGMRVLSSFPFAPRRKARVEEETALTGLLCAVCI